MSQPSVIVLGLDGAPIELVREWARAGDLPNLASLIERGASGTLRSTLPATTPVAWPSIYTGANPGRHGAFGFMKRSPDSYDWAKTTSLDIALPCLWDILSIDGLRSAVFFAPYTFPAREMKGTMVTGRGGPRRLTDRVTYPSSLGADLAGEFGERRLFGPRMSGRSTLAETADRLVDSVEMQTEAVLRSLARDHADMVFVVWDQTDTAAHLFWHHSDLPTPGSGSPMHRIYRAVDHAIGRLLGSAGGDPLTVVCSDHGTHPTRFRIRMPLWLEQQGFLSLPRARKGSKLHGAAAAWRKLPAGLRSVVPERARHRVATSMQPSSGSAIDWRATRAYPQPVSAEALYLNRAGREPSGIVTAGEAEEVTERLVLALTGLTTPDGNRAVDRVFRNEEIYTGDHTGIGPDLVAETVPSAMFSHAFLGDSGVFTEPIRPDLSSREHRPIGYHKREGMIVLAGPRVIPTTELEANVEDVAPTILRYLKAPYPDHMDGVAIESAFHSLDDPRVVSEFFASKAPADGLSPEEAAEVDRHLKDLGYIE